MMAYKFALTTFLWLGTLTLCSCDIFTIEESDGLGCKSVVVSNGQVQPALTREKKYYARGNQIEVRCNDRYFALGKGKAVCLGGKWSNSLKCVYGCNPPDISYGKSYPQPKRYVHEPGTRVNFKCRRGYKRRGSSRAKCTGNNQWDADLPTCTRIRSICHHPATLNIGSHFPVKKVYAEGERITWSCRGGYILRGSKTSVCRKSGNFSPLGQKCEAKLTDRKAPERAIRFGAFLSIRKACTRPKLPTSGSFEPRRALYHLGAEVKYSCAKGYHLIGSATSICKREGFKPEPPECVVVRCKPPLVPKYGNIVNAKDEYNYNEQVQYECDKNYIMRGSEYAVCQYSGQFSPQPPSCRPPSCRTECKYVKGRICQCDAACVYDGNCCIDFDQYCRKLFY